MSVVSANFSPAEPAVPLEPRGRPLGRWAVFGILLILGVSYSFNGMDRQVFPALLGPIRAEYGLSLSQSGFLANAFTLNIAVFGALSGWFMGRFGRKATLVSGLAAYSLFTAATPFALGFADLTFYRAMTGAGEALHIGAIYAMLGAYFGSRRGVFMGINNSFFGVGAFLGPFLGARLFALSGSWRTPFVAFGVAGLVAAITVAVAVPRHFSEAIDPEAVPAGRHSATSGSILNMNSILCLAAFTLIGCSFFAYVALYTTYLRTELSYSVTDAGTTFGMFGIGALTGLWGGWLSERLKKPGLLASLLLLAVDGFLMFHSTSSIWVQAIASLIFGSLISGYLYPRMVTLMQRSVAADQIGHAMAFLLVTFYLPGLFVGYAFGWLVETFGWSVASTLAVSLPAAGAFLITVFYDARRLRGG